MPPIPEAGGTRLGRCPHRRWQAYRQPVLCQCHPAPFWILASTSNSDPVTMTLSGLPGSNTLHCPGTAYLHHAAPSDGQNCYAPPNPTLHQLVNDHYLGLSLSPMYHQPEGFLFRDHLQGCAEEGTRETPIVGQGSLHPQEH